MKLLLLLTFLIASAIQVPQTARGTIEGRVLKAGTGEPIPNTPVTLISSAGLSDTALTGLLDQMSQLVTGGLQGQGGGGSQDLTIQQVTNLLQSAGPNVSTQASMLTDRAGHFAFSDLPPGRYTVWVQRFNYFGPLQNGFRSSTASSTITVDAPNGGGFGADMVLYLIQGLAISGRVVDALGQPAIGMAITAYRSTYAEGKPLWTSVVSRPIDDRGDYRLSPLPPGDYYVGVTPPPNLVAPAGANPSVRTFFPGVTDPLQATRLTLKNGDAPRVDFSLRTAPVAFFKITGFAVNPAPSSPATGVVDKGFSSFILIPAESNLNEPNTFVNAVSVENRAGGEFEIRNVRPGIYELYPVVSNSSFPSGRTIVDVRSADVPGVRISVNPGVVVQGKVAIADGIPQKLVNLDAVRVVLLPWIAPSIFRSSVSLPIDDDGRFEVRGPAGALLNLQVDGLPDTAYVADVLVGANSFPSGGFGLSSSEQIQVIIDASKGATVDTTVLTAGGSPAPRERVVLVPSEDQRQNPSRYKVGTTDNAGHLVIRGIAPGSYTAFAWESVPDTAWLNKEFLSKYQDLGAPVTLLPGAQTKLQLKSIPFDTEQR
jgi:hypothetical protein